MLSIHHCDKCSAPIELFQSQKRQRMIFLDPCVRWPYPDDSINYKTFRLCNKCADHHDRNICLASGLLFETGEYRKLSEIFYANSNTGHKNTEDYLHNLVNKLSDELNDLKKKNHKKTK